MKILFLTTFDVTLQHDHFFTRNVVLELLSLIEGNNDELIVATISGGQLSEDQLEYVSPNNEKIETKLVKLSDVKNRERIIEDISDFLKFEKPDIIHSQMVERYDIEAAKKLNIPIITTIHIGGFICPRGGGDGFLKYDDSICKQPIGKDCAKCLSKKLPFSNLSYLLHKITPSKLKLKLAKKLLNNYFYLTPFLHLTTKPWERKEFLELARYSHKICASSQLIDLFKINGIKENLHLIPHGVKPRERLALPALDGPVKFYFMARPQYSKGLHIIVEALKDIPLRLYELHVLGDGRNLDKRDNKYFNKIKASAKDLNIFFHGWVANNELEKYVKDFHVMIHSTICHEIYGISIAETLSMGRPVLATRCGGAEEQIKEGINGWLVEPNNVDEMRQKILHIINHKEEILKFADNATLPHPLDEYGEKLYQLYKDIVIK